MTSDDERRPETLLKTGDRLLDESKQLLRDLDTLTRDRQPVEIPYDDVARHSGLPT